MKRTPEQQAADFIAANDRSLVVAASVLHTGKDVVQGAQYILDDRSKHYLSSAAARLLPDTYPKWRLG